MMLTSFLKVTGEQDWDKDLYLYYNISEPVIRGLSDLKRMGGRNEKMGVGSAGFGMGSTNEYGFDG